MIIVCLLGFFILTIKAIDGVTVSNLISQSAFKCMLENGYYFAIVRAYCPYGAVDINADANLKNAGSNALITDISMYPCRGKQPTVQVQELYNSINKQDYGGIWIAVQQNKSAGCDWGIDYSSNCVFLMEIINRIRKYGGIPSIFSSKAMWQKIMGGRFACPEAASQWIWYAEQDGQSGFTHFQFFGGWTRPSMKQFTGEKILCGEKVGLNYCE